MFYDLLYLVMRSAELPKNDALSLCRYTQKSIIAFWTLYLITILPIIVLSNG